MIFKLLIYIWFITNAGMWKCNDFDVLFKQNLFWLDISAVSHVLTASELFSSSSLVFKLLSTWGHYMLFDS